MIPDLRESDGEFERDKGTQKGIYFFASMTRTPDTTRKRHDSSKKDSYEDRRIQNLQNFPFS